MNANYRKLNDRSLNSSTYHKKDGTAVRTKLKAETAKNIGELLKSLEGLDPVMPIVLNPTDMSNPVQCTEVTQHWMDLKSDNLAYHCVVLR